MSSPASQALRDALRAALGGATAGGLVVLGVGSVLHGDDGAGVRVAEALLRAPIPGTSAIDAGTVPENHTAEIRRLAPARLLIVDSAEMGEEPGAVRLIDPPDIRGASFSTHGLPMDMLVDYIRATIGCRVTLVGIQPRSVALGGVVSPEVDAAVRAVADALREFARGA
jgi:hydrogenase 3 maturation protease